MTQVVDNTVADRVRLPRTRADLERALEVGELRVVFDPIVELRTRLPVGAEALLHRQQADTAVAPADFWHLLGAPLARRVSAFVLDTACRELAGWRRGGVCPQLSVNVDPRELTADWARDVLAALHRHGLPAAALTLELTEAAREQSLGVTAYAAALVGAGVGFALDGAGTGFNALTFIRDMPFGELKIAREFVGGIGQARSEAVVRALVLLARELGLRTVADGVATDAQASWLAAEGVDRAQGPLFGVPLTAEAARAMWRSDRAMVGGAFLRHLHESGSSLTTIAALLNTRGVPAPSGRRWHPRAVAKVLTSPTPYEAQDSRASGHSARQSEADSASWI